MEFIFIKQLSELSMNEKPQTNLPAPSVQNVILIGDDFPSHENDFQSLQFAQQRSSQQQQQVMVLNNKKNQQQQHFLIQVDDNKPPVLQESDMQRQFEEIKFGSAECNLMDLDVQNDDGKKSILQLTPYEYEQFVYNRVIQIQTPQLITEGYIMSYKLYQIKTRLKLDTKKQQLTHKKRNALLKEQQSYSDSAKSSNNQNSKNTKPKQKQDELEYDTCVSRRFSDFEYLNELLISNYGGFIIPLLPEKNFWTIVNLEGKDYAEARTKSLTKYLNRLFTHKKLKHSQELKNFLFQQDNKFSTQKGEFLQKKKRLQDKIISISSGALEYGKALYSRFMGGGADKNKNQEEIRLSKNKLTKDDLTFSEYEIIVAELMRIMSDTKTLVENVIQEIQTIDDITMLLSSGLTDSFNFISSKLTLQLENKQSSRVKSQSGQKQSFPTQQISEEFQEISQFVSSCHAAIHRRKTLRQEIQQLKQQQQTFIEKYKNSPRSLQLDMIRSKLSKLNKMNETYAQELIKELQFHVDQGKGMLRVFVSKFENLRRKFFASAHHFNNST